MVREPSRSYAALLTVNKRFSRLAYDVYISSERFAARDLPLLGPRRSSHSRVRLLTYEASAPFQHVHLSDFAIISLFDNLSSLVLKGPVPEDTNLTSAFTNALRNLKNLRELKLLWSHTYSIVDTSFTLGAAFPQLRSLEITDSCRSAVQLLADPMPTLASLFLYGVPYQHVPWTTLRELEVLLPGPADSGSTQQLVASLEAAFKGQAVSVTYTILLPL
jgi:hypothetical protein